jgi:DegV family protein with EDD domain
MVKVVTDSSSDIPSQVAQELGITVIPLQVRFGTEVYRDRVDLSTEEFYSRLTTSRIHPTTAAPTTGIIAETYDKLAEETDEILCIHLSSKWSAAFHEAALQAKEQMKRSCRVEVIDSLSAIMGEGLMVIAAEETQRGASLDQIADVVRKTIPKSHASMTFDTLEYLRRGGRIGKAQYLLGSILKVNPILGIRDGEAGPVGRQRSRAKAVEWLYKFVKGFEGRIRSLAVEHATTPGEAEALAQRFDPLFPRERIYITQITPAIGAHVGPHVLGVSLLEE